MRSGKQLSTSCRMNPFFLQGTSLVCSQAVSALIAKNSYLLGVWREPSRVNILLGEGFSAECRQNTRIFFSPVYILYTYTCSLPREAERIRTSLDCKSTKTTGERVSRYDARLVSTQLVAMKSKTEKLDSTPGLHWEFQWSLFSHVPVSQNYLLAGMAKNGEVTVLQRMTHAFAFFSG